MRECCRQGNTISKALRLQSAHSFEEMRRRPMRLECNDRGREKHVRRLETVLRPSQEELCRPPQEVWALLRSSGKPLKQNHPIECFYVLQTVLSNFEQW